MMGDAMATANRKAKRLDDPLHRAELLGRVLVQAAERAAALPEGAAERRELETRARRAWDAYFEIDRRATAPALFIVGEIEGALRFLAWDATQRSEAQRAKLVRWLAETAHRHVRETHPRAAEALARIGDPAADIASQIETWRRRRSWTSLAAWLQRAGVWSGTPESLRVESSAHRNP